MSSILASVTSGTARTGIRAIIAAVEKMGKTTLVAGAPNVLLVPLEVGYAGVTCAKTPMLQTYEETLQLVQEIMHYAKLGQFPYRTIAFDSATGLERQIHDYVLRCDPTYAASAQSKKTLSMESAHGGYGRAYTLANTHMTNFLGMLDQLAVNGGINILFTCHVFSSRVMDPTAGEYDSWDLLLHSPKNQKTYGKRELMTQWADLIGFLYEPVFLVKADGSNMTKATSQNKGRVMGLSRTPSYIAGNRFGILGELPIPAPPAIGWNNLADALHKTSGIDIYTR